MLRKVGASGCEILQKGTYIEKSSGILPAGPRRARSLKGPGQTLMVCPTIQESIFNILARFRLHKMAFSTDIEKMYLQVKRREKDRDFHRFLMRDDKGRIQDYRMTSVTFGVASSARHAQRSILQLALDEELSVMRSSGVTERFVYG